MGTTPYILYKVINKKGEKATAVKFGGLTPFLTAVV